MKLIIQVYQNVHIYLERYPFELNPLESVNTNFDLNKDYDSIKILFIYNSKYNE